MRILAACVDNNFCYFLGKFLQFGGRIVLIKKKSINSSKFSPLYKWRFLQILSHEIPLIRGSLAKICGMNGQKITYICVSKSHNVRLFRDTVRFSTIWCSILHHPSCSLIISLNLWSRHQNSIAESRIAMRKSEEKSSHFNPSFPYVLFQVTNWLPYFADPLWRPRSTAEHSPRNCDRLTAHSPCFQTVLP